MVSSSAANDDDDIVKNNTTDQGSTSDATIASLHSLLEYLDNPETKLLPLLNPPPPPPPNAAAENNNDEVKDAYDHQTKDLYRISSVLFSRLEQLASLQERLEERQKQEMAIMMMGEEEKNNEEEADCPLSGIPELHVGSLSDSNDNDNDDDSSGDGGLVNVETIWSQVEIQNEALVSMLKKSVKKLKKKTLKSQGGRRGGGGDEEEYMIRLLNMDDLDNSDDDDDDDQNVVQGSDGDDDTSDDDDNDSDDNSMEEEDDDDDEEEDEEARRIRERMERTMAEMEESSDEGLADNDSDDDEENKSAGGKEEEEKEDTTDPARQELYDGFFDMHEMEAFADDEEEMLPDDAYGEPQPDTEEDMEERKKKLPHLRGRTGEDDDEDNGGDGSDDDDDDEFDELEKRNDQTVRRRRYRDDDDIKALANLYDEENESDDEDDDVAANMTAAEFFGQRKKPSKEYLSNRKVKNNKKDTIDEDADEVDSWDGHDFSEEQNWRDDQDEDEDEDKKAEPDDEKSEAESNEEEEEMAEDNDSDGNSDEEKKVKKLSKHAVHSKKLEELTEELEKEALAEKPWQMVGEAKGTERPSNSLLQATPDFELALKLAPTVTVEHTMSIEDMIKKRILDEDWDDVIPRELPDIGLNQRKGELPEVSQEKSKLSLGELYEREYLKKSTGYDKDAEEKETEEEKVKNEMKMIFANLTSKLDALSNYHFAPRPVADEADVKTSATPAIAMEEVLPLHVSDARASAPEEIYAQKQGRESILRGDSEMDQADRKRQRQAKKAARRKSRKAKLADEKLISKLQPGLGLNNPYEKRKMREELQMARASGKVTTGEIDQNADFKTSTKFFEKMQIEAEQTVQGDGNIGKGQKRKRDIGENSKSSSFKL